MSDRPEAPPFAFDEESEKQIPAIIAKYPEGRQASAVLGLLYLAQAQMHRRTGSAWLPITAMDEVARRLAMPSMRVYEVATFYTMLNTKPVGRYNLQVCTTTPCWLRGSDAVMAACREFTGLTQSGQTTEDGMFSLLEVECLGACVNAPVIQINDDFYEDLDGPRTLALLEAFRRGELPPPGSSIGRQGSAPEGGPTTLFNVKTDATAESAGADQE
ncbi:MAG TPA: NAD(P)H-dependent oxidoreductase subunit E [Acetobacteraceae bacterium]|nr:NAD(P)H-dependent oxidoreductase subunit E [Acetobacteraceae bacterium]